MKKKCCPCRTVIIQPEPGVFRLRGKMALAKDGRIFMVCKECDFEVDITDEVDAYRDRARDQEAQRP